jgi:hypothetical protein
MAGEGGARALEARPDVRVQERRGERKTKDAARSVRDISFHCY